MPITTTSGMLDDCTSINVNTGDIGLPEAPDSWGHEGGGYINDYPDNTFGGMTTYTSNNEAAPFNSRNKSVYRVYPWWAIFCEKTYNPNGANFRVQLRSMRSYRRVSGSWTLHQTLADARGQEKDYRMPGDINYDWAHNDPAVDHLGFPGRDVSMSSGGWAIELINDWAGHGFPMNFISPDYSTWEAVGVTLFARLVPKDATQIFDWGNYRVSINVGSDNYGDRWVSEHCHGRFKRLTDQWQVFTSATVTRPSGKSNQGKGITVDQYNNAPLPIPPEDQVWLERGAYSSVANTQTLVLKRSAPVSSGKTYTLSVARGTASAVPASVVMAAGSASVQFVVTTPATLPTDQQILYATDGSTEDHWGSFVFGTGTSSGDTGGTPGTGSTSTRTNRLFQSGNMAVAPWDLKSGTAGTADANGWQLLTNGPTEEPRQLVAGFGASETSTLSFDAAQGSADWVLVRIEDGTFANGCHQFVNALTGEVGTGSTHGTVSGLVCTAALLAGGGVRVKLSLPMAATSRHAVIRAVSGNNGWTHESGLTVYLRKWQFQSGTIGTNPIPTTTVAVTRTLTTATLTGTTATPVAAALTGTLTLLDNASAGWDQFSENLLTSSAPAVVSVAQPAAATGADGKATFQYTPLANGSANLTAVSGNVTSPALAITVSGTAVTLDPPAAPTVSVSNSDTVVVSVGSIDVDATDVIVEAATATGPTSGIYLELARVTVGSLPISITGLAPGTLYNVRARVAAGGMSSTPSGDTIATTKKLYVEGYASTRALGATADVQVFRAAPADKSLPLGESIGNWTATFSAAPSTVDGISQAAIRVELTTQPSTGKLRSGDRMSMICVQNSPRTSTQPMNNAKVIEE